MTRKRNDLNKYQQLAKNNGGECLSIEYLGAGQKLKFKCKKGHIWETKAVNISGKNRWCPMCAANKKLSLQDAINFAKQFDGYCLSSKYNNCTHKLKWKCKYGHEWDATFVSIKNSKGWCPQCTGKFFSENVVRKIFELILNRKFPKKKPEWLKFGKSFLELDGYCEELGIAFEHNGLQHYNLTPFSNFEQLKKIQTRDRHKKKLCKEYGVKLIIVPDIFNKLGIDNVIKFIKNKLYNLKIATINRSFNIIDIMNQEKSTSCADKMSEILEFVSKKGGKCLTNYTNSRIKLKFQCVKGHEWLAIWSNIKFGTWCPICYKISRKIIYE